MEERRTRRLARLRRQKSRLRTETVAAGDGAQVVEQTGGLRFFLNRTSHIEKAPSIGPRTATMLETIGIHTVEDLMNMPAERISKMLNHRRMTPQVIQQWQQQSRMMRQVPEICAVTMPGSLSRAASPRPKIWLQGTPQVCSRLLSRSPWSKRRRAAA